MTKQSLTEALQQMATWKDDRSETARLRDVYEEVETALQKGISRKAVLEALHKDGFTMSLKMFDKALYRIRKVQRSGITTKVHAKKHSVDGHKTDSTTMKPTQKEVESAPRASMTPEDFREIRNKPHDWVALNQPVKTS